MDRRGRVSGLALQPLPPSRPVFNQHLAGPRMGKEIRVTAPHETRHQDHGEDGHRGQTGVQSVLLTGRRRLDLEQIVLVSVIVIGEVVVGGAVVAVIEAAAAVVPRRVVGVERRIAVGSLVLLRGETEFVAVDFLAFGILTSASGR